ncbi:MAG: SRPBCC domain-containing protein [Bacteroidota bacterium]
MPATNRKSAPPEETTRKSTQIKQKVFIPASPDEVFDAYLDSKKHSAMTGGEAKLDPHAGGIFSAWDGYISGTLFELERGKRIVQDWITTEWPEGYPRSVLSITLTPKKNGTELLLLQECVPASQAKDYERGWKDFYWKPMQKYFAKIHPKEKTTKASRKK